MLAQSLLVARHLRPTLLQGVNNLAGPTVNHRTPAGLVELDHGDVTMCVPHPGGVDSELSLVVRVRGPSVGHDLDVRRHSKFRTLHIDTYSQQRVLLHCNAGIDIRRS